MSERKDRIVALREGGLTYRQIAAAEGVSFQYVAMVCGKANVCHFKRLTERDCIYFNLRNWLNQNQMSRNELLRQMGMVVCGRNCERVRNMMRGEYNLPKSWIDKLIAVTNIPYEHLFAEDTHE